jgi:hypothetical protein
MMRSILVFWVFVALGCGGADPADPGGVPREVIDDTRTLLVGELAEGILTGGSADKVVMQLSAPSATLDWNIHGHPGSTTETVAEGFDQMDVDYTFVPSEQADWYLLVRNRGTAPLDVAVHLELFGAVTWSGWQ